MTLLTSTSYQDTHPLKPLVHSLGQIVTNSEDDFLSLGMNLQKIQMMSSSQRQKISAAMDLFKANDDVGVMQQISAYVQRSQQDTQTAQQTATNLCADLTTMMKLLDEIAKKGRTLEQAGLFLHVIGINTGIECARQQQMAAMFTVVSRDTIVLAGQIRDATETLFDKTTQAKNEQKKTLIEAQKSIESLDQLARGSEQATETALSKVAELIDYSISMVNEAKRMSGSITTEINRVVMGIQFHDNLRQRIEHVNSALLETETLHADPSAELVCNTYLSVELQKAQLDSLICELETLYTTQSQALGNIVQEVSGLETRLESMASEQSTGTSQDDPVAVLLTGIESLERLNCDSQVLAETIRTSAERAEQIVGDMHDAVKSTFVIANSVKINALNAIIKAAKFGRHGESLQVLAQGMVTVSCDTRELINIFNELLEQLSGLTRKEAGEVDEQKDLSADVDFDSAQVQQVFHDFRAELLSSHRDCRSLAQNLENEQRSLISISNLKDALQLHINQLGHYLESIQPQDAELLATMRKSFGEQLEGRYTMNEERDIHRHLLQQSAASPVTTQAVNSGDSDDCLFFDQPVAETPPATEEVELWGDSPTASADTAVELFDDTPGTSPAAAPDEIELWDETPAESSVELFDDVPSGQSAAAPDEIELWDETPASSVDASVELFDAAPATPTTDDVELWGDVPTSSGSDAESTSLEEPISAIDDKKTDNKEEDFGDNVDLF